MQLLASVLWHIANILFGLSLNLHQRYQTAFWQRVEVGWREVEERVEEMRQLEAMGEKGGG